MDWRKSWKGDARLVATYLVAVSGGVDSVVLLDVMKRAKHRIIVAHVDHGIRGDESAADARFVAALAKWYRVPFVSTSLHLAKTASEDEARQRRYDFLFSEAKKHRAMVVTAHHQNDVVETVALNIQRGTGWRGLAVLARPDVYRPLLGLTKQQIYAYAIKHRLEWVEDATNQSNNYARNRVRHAIGAKDVPSGVIAALRARQLQLRHEIAHETARLVEQHDGSRYFLNQLDTQAAVELFAAIVVHHGGVRPTYPRAHSALLAIKTAKPGAVYQLGDGVSLRFTTRNYRVIVI